MSDRLDYARPQTPDLRAEPRTPIGEPIRRALTPTAFVDHGGLRVAPEPATIGNLLGGFCIIVVPIAVALQVAWPRARNSAEVAALVVASVCGAGVAIAMASGAARLYQESREHPPWLTVRGRRVTVSGERYSLGDFDSLEYVETSVDEVVDGELRLVRAGDGPRVAVVRAGSEPMRALLPIVAREMRLPLVEFLVEGPRYTQGIWHTPADGERVQIEPRE